MSLACPFGLSSVSSFIFPRFTCLFSLLHAMAVVLHADETVRGTTAGSHFSGNFQDTEHLTLAFSPTKQARVPASQGQA